MTARTRSKTQEKTVTLDILPHGRDEMNLAELPIAVLAERAPKGVKTLIFHDGRGKLTVTGSDAYGLPTALDADVIVALIQLTKQKNNFLNPTINFTRYELLRLLGWANEGKSYRRIEEALNRWHGVSLHYDGCWWDNRSKQYGDAKIHIIESVIILDGKRRIDGDEQQALPLSSFTWNKVFMESCQADNLKRLNVETYFSLEHSSSKRLYRFLDKRFYHRPEWIFDLKEIAFERVGLSRNYGPNVGKIKEKLQPAIDELEGRQFLEPMTRDERYFKDGRDWKIRLAAKAPVITRPALPDSAFETTALIEALTQRGVTRATAVEIVERYAAEAIQQKIDVFDWLAQKQDKRMAQSPAGFLVKSINQDFATPKGFVSKAEQQAQQEAKAKKEQAAAAKRRQEQQEAEREQAERHAADAYWASLSPEQQAKLDAESIDAAAPATLAAETGPLKSTLQRVRRDLFIRALLKARSIDPTK